MFLCDSDIISFDSICQASNQSYLLIRIFYNDFNLCQYREIFSRWIIFGIYLNRQYRWNIRTKNCKYIVICQNSIIHDGFSIRKICICFNILQESTKITLSFIQSNYCYRHSTSNFSNPTLTLENLIPGTVLTSVREVDVNFDDTKFIRCGYEGFQIVSNNVVVLQKTTGYQQSYSCKFSPVNDEYAVVKASKNLQIYHQNNTVMASFRGTGDIWGMDWNSNGTLLAFIQNGNGLWVINKLTNVSTKYSSTTGSPNAVDWSPNDQMIAYNIYANRTIIINAVTKGLISNYTTTGQVYEMRFSPDSRKLAQARGAQRKVVVYSITCPNGSYQAVNSSLCSNCVSPCNTCTSSTACLTCVAGYIINSSSCIVDCSSISKCLTCIINPDPNFGGLQCTICDANHKVSNKVCAPNCSIITNCDTCHVNTVNVLLCDTCLIGYQLHTSNNTCQLYDCSGMIGCNFCTVVYYSSTASTQLECLNCSTYFVLAGITCQINCSSISQCTSCYVNSSNSLRCLNCSSLFYLSNNQCELNCALIDKCVNCSLTSTLQCTNCQTNYILSTNNTCLPKCSVIDKCTNCTLDSNNSITCTECSFGFQVVNKICMIVCGVANYRTSPTQCVACKNGCIFCDNSACSLCSHGKIIGQGCTQVIGCQDIQSLYQNTTNNCKKCIENQNFVLNTPAKTCQCKPGYDLNNNICHNIIGCLAPIMISNVIQCKTCNFIYNFVLVNNSCICKHGFSLQMQSKTCEQICGDGILFKHRCDDGNTNDGDGCSSSCMVQSKFGCQGGNETHPSVCFLKTKSLFYLNMVQTSKKDDQNTVTFKFKFSQRLLFTNNQQQQNVGDFKLELNGTQDYVWSFQNQEINIELNFNQTIENNPIRISFTLNNVPLFRTIQFDQIFKVKSDTQPLIFKSKQDQHKDSLMKIVITALFILIIAMSFIMSTLHKMAGVQMLHTYLLICYLFIIQVQKYSLRSFLQILDQFKINFADILNKINNKVFNPQIFTQALSSLVYYAVTFLFVSIFAILYLLKKAKIIKIKLISFKKKLYNKFVFPLTMAFIYEILQIQINILQEDYSSKYGKLLIALSIIFKSFAFGIISYELSALFFKKSSKKYNNFVRLSQCSQSYIVYYIMNYTIIMSFLTILNRKSFQFYLQVLLAYMLVVFIKFIRVLPYKHNIHNVVHIVNMITVLLFLGYLIISNRIPSVVCFGAMIVLNIIFNFIRMGFIFKQKCCKKQKDMLKNAHKRFQQDIKKHNKKQIHKYLIQQRRQDILYQKPILFQKSELTEQHKRHINMQKAKNRLAKQLGLTTKPQE